MTKHDFVQMLESHDWTYQRSDDHRKWKRGCEQRKSIMAAKVLEQIAIRARILDIDKNEIE